MISLAHVPMICCLYSPLFAPNTRMQNLNFSACLFWQFVPSPWNWFNSSSTYEYSTPPTTPWANLSATAADLHCNWLDISLISRSIEQRSSCHVVKCTLVVARWPKSNRKLMRHRPPSLGHWKAFTSNANICSGSLRYNTHYIMLLAGRHHTQRLYLLG